MWQKYYTKIDLNYMFFAVIFIFCVQYQGRAATGMQDGHTKESVLALPGRALLYYGTLNKKTEFLISYKELCYNFYIIISSVDLGKLSYRSCDFFIGRDIVAHLAVVKLLVCNKIKVTCSCKTEYDGLFLAGLLAL